MERTKVIYALVDPEGNIGYVGSTSVNAKTRYWEHRSRAREMHAAPVYDWIRKVGIDTFSFIELENLGINQDLALVEANWIKKLIEAGHPLQNQIARDGVPYSNGQRMKDMLSENRRGKPTWIKGKRGVAAGWTDERKALVTIRFAEKRESQHSQ